jgi:peroxiredoxin
LRTTCPYCRATLPVWERVADSLRRVATPRIELFGISLDPAESTRAYVRTNHLSYPVLTFPDRKLLVLYRAVATPETVVLDGGGRVLYAHTGLLDSAAMLDSVFHAATTLPPRVGLASGLLGAPVAGGRGR